MTAQTATQTDADAQRRQPPPRSTRDLVEHELDVGEIAAHVRREQFYVVVRDPDAVAGELEVAPDGTLDEWIDVDPDADVLEVIGEQRIDDAIGRFDDAEDVLAAVRDGRITPQAVPARQLTPVLEEFLDERRAGEWSGVAAYASDGRGER